MPLAIHVHIVSGNVGTKFLSNILNGFWNIDQGLSLCTATPRLWRDNSHTFIFKIWFRTDGHTTPKQYPPLETFVSAGENKAAGWPYIAHQSLKSVKMWPCDKHSDQVSWRLDACNNVEKRFLIFYLTTLFFYHIWPSFEHYKYLMEAFWPRWRLGQKCAYTYLFTIYISKSEIYITSFLRCITGKTYLVPIHELVPLSVEIFLWFDLVT